VQSLKRSARWSPLVYQHTFWGSPSSGLSLISVWRLILVKRIFATTQITCVRFVYVIYYHLLFSPGSFRMQSCK
jgi:hypothetical protein